MITAGVVVGVAASFALSRLLAANLYGVSSADYANYIVVVILLGVTALAACLVPARRAARLEPSVVLRKG